MSTSFTRRAFLRRSAGAAASLSVLGYPLLRPERALAAPVVRLDLGGLSSSSASIVSYAKAVSAMKALPASDPLSWTYQAAIHGTDSMASMTAWNTCEHHTLYFWSWHRMYLYYFEKIIRRMSGDSGWALPYWNYELAGERQLPPMFRDPSSSLYTANRGFGWNSGAASLPSWVVDTSAGMPLLDYSLASSSLEGTPHDDVHIQIGGWMRRVQTAAQDPIFYLHHANMDRLWNLWLAQGGGRTDPLTDSTWKNTQYTFFDQNRNQVKLTGCDVLRAALQLNYRYENEPAQVNEYCIRIIKPPYLIRKILFRWPIPPFVLGLIKRVKIDIRKFQEQLTTLAASPTDTILIQLDGVEAARQPGAVWQVFLAPPQVTKLDPDGPFRIGNLSLFSAGIRNEGHHHGFLPASFSFAADRAIQAAAQFKPPSLLLTFVASGPLINGKASRPKLLSPVSVGKVTTLVVSQKR